MFKWSRVRLILSVLACEGLISTLIERVQIAEVKGKRASNSLDSGGISHRAAAAMYRDFTGVLHVHSTYSDGIGTIHDISLAAREAGVDYVLMCDHSNLDALGNDEAGWRNDVLMLIGTEVTTDSGHLLVVDVSEDFLPCGKDSVGVQHRVDSFGGFSVIALPCDLKDRWRDFDHRIPEVGLEVFNLSAIARTKINLPALILIWRRYHGRNRQSAFHLVSSRPKRELELWDNLAADAAAMDPPSRVVGIASLDAHAVMKFGGRAYPYPTYSEIFRTLRTHVVIPVDAEFGQRRESSTSDSDMKLAHQALSDGHCFMAYDNYADSKGFIYTGSVGGSAEVLMGEFIQVPSGTDRLVTLSVSAPSQKSFGRMYRNGKLFASWVGPSFKIETQTAGVYRVEIFLYWYRIGYVFMGTRPWIFSNPIYVTQKKLAFAAVKPPSI